LAHVDSQNPTMKNKLILSQLKRSFAQYAPLWQAWKTSGRAALSKKQIAQIDQFLQTDFKVFRGTNCETWEDEIQTLQVCLDNDYNNFKEWVIATFQFSILRLTESSNLDDFFMLPFEKTDLHPTQLKHLRKFKVRSFYELFETYSEKDFKSEPLFFIIANYQKDYNMINSSSPKSPWI
jgi:hypothetical protein